MREQIEGKAGEIDDADAGGHDGLLSAIGRRDTMAGHMSKRARWLVIGGLVVVIAVLGGWYWSDHAAVARFHDAHSEARLRGKTVEEVMAMCGQPHVMQRGGDGKLAFITYKNGEREEYCEISFDKGGAAGVSLSGE